MTDEKANLREELETQMLKHPGLKNIVKISRKARKNKEMADGKYHEGLLKMVKDVLDTVQESKGTGESQAKLMEQNIGVLSKVTDVLVRMKAQSVNGDIKMVEELGSVKEILENILAKPMNVHVEAPIVKAPIVNVPETKVIQETKEVKEAVEVLKMILHRTVKNASTVISNSEPKEAIAVRLVDKSGKEFVDPREGGGGVAVAGGGGQSTINDTNMRSFEGALTPGVPVTVDLFSVLGRASVEGYIICDGVGSFTIASSNNGTVFGDELTMESKERIEWGEHRKFIVRKIRLTPSATASNYRIAYI